jgi:hypothetical protein
MYPPQKILQHPPLPLIGYKNGLTYYKINILALKVNLTLLKEPTAGYQSLFVFAPATVVFSGGHLGLRIIFIKY